MKQSLEAGLAASLGLEQEKITLTHINGNIVTRRLANSAELTFTIESLSSSPEQIDALRANIVAAAIEGSVVANIQKSASDRGVLTSALFTMPRAISTPTIELFSTTKVVYRLRRANTVAPTSAPTHSLDHPDATALPTFAPTYRPTVAPTAAPTISYAVGIAVHVKATYVSEVIKLVDAMEVIERNSVERKVSPSVPLSCWPGRCNACPQAEDECCSNYVAHNNLCSACVESKGCQSTGYTSDPGIVALVVESINTASNNLQVSEPSMHLEFSIEAGVAAIEHTDNAVVAGQVDGYPECDSGLCTSEAPSFGAALVDLQLPLDWASKLPSFGRMSYTVGVTDFTEAKVVPSQVDLDFTNPVAQVVVIGVDDDAMDGKRHFEVIFTGVLHYRHADGYDTQKPVMQRRMEFLNLDDDVAGLKVVQAPGDQGRLTYEALPYRITNPATFTVELTSEPCCAHYCPCSDAQDLDGVLSPVAKVVVPVTSMKATKAVAAQPVLTFNQNNWKVKQEANFTGVDDKIADYHSRIVDSACALEHANNPRDLQACITDKPTKYNVLFGVCDSPTDTSYHGQHFKQFTNMGSVNDDVIGINMTQLSNTTSENGATTAKVQISLLTEPKASIMVTLVSNRADKSWCSPAIFAFSSVDWNIPQLSVIQGFDDDLPDGDVPYNMSAVIIFSEDPDYRNLEIGMNVLKQSRSFISIGEPDCAKLVASAEDFTTAQCDGPYSEATCKPGE
jgi:hypothetical protein